MLRTLRKISFLKSAYHIIMAIITIFYFMLRFILFSSVGSRLNAARSIKFRLRLLTHAIEKILILPKIDTTRGTSASNELNTLLDTSPRSAVPSDDFTAGHQALSALCQIKGNEPSGATKHFSIANQNNNLKVGGAQTPKTNISFCAENFDVFFGSRSSHRFFQNKIISDETVGRVIKSASNSPSVCNRSAWKVYHFNNNTTIQEILKKQNGNASFGQNVRNLFIITVDTKAFFEGKEVCQSWIEGGIFSSSLIWAIHANNLVSCALNWSVTPKQDITLRKYLSIPQSENLIMLIAFGQKLEGAKICTANKPSMNEILIKE